MRARRFEQSGADGVMIGRGAYGRPWLLAQVMSELGAAEGADRIRASTSSSRPCSSNMRRCSQLYGTQTGVNLARKHIGWYTKGLPGSAELRNKVNQQDDPAVVIAHVAGILFAVARALGGLTRSCATECVV